MKEYIAPKNVTWVKLIDNFQVINLHNRKKNVILKYENSIKLFAENYDKNDQINYEKLFLHVSYVKLHNIKKSSK